MRFGLAFLCALAFSGAMQAQYQDTVWTVKGWKPLDHHFTQWKPDVHFDARTSSINGKRVRIGGIRLGAEYRRVHRFGIGFYGATTPVDNGANSAETPGLDSARLNLNYASLFYERVLLLHPKWEWSAAVHLGAGTVAVTYGNQSVQSLGLDEQISVRPIEWSTSGYYHIWYWLSAGGGIGFRQITSAPQEIRKAYQGSMYVVKVRVKLIKLLRSSWNNSVRHEY